MNRRIALLAALLATACPGPTPPGPDAGPEIPPGCKSTAEADSEERCQLPLDVEKEGMLSTLGQSDYWRLQIDSLPPRALLKVVAQYRSASSPVVVSVNVLASDGLSSIASATDPRRASSTTAAGPGPAQAVAVMKSPGTYYVVVRHDDSAEDPALDKKNPYYLSATLSSDPDQNEPNETPESATTIPLAGCNAPAQVSGALSTAGDVDYLTFTVSPCPGPDRTLLFLEMVAPASPGPKLRVEYTLTGPAGEVVATGYSPSPMVDQRIATSRVIGAGKHVLKVNAYRSPHDVTDPSGDPEFVYTAKVALYSDKDTNEGTGGNDLPATATPVAVAVGSQRVMTGRLSYVGDRDVYAVTAPAAGARVHYRLSYRAATAAPPQFQAIPTLASKELLLYDTLPVAGCAAACPGDTAFSGPWCKQGKCLRHLRVEDSSIHDLRNFEGSAFVPGGATWYLEVGFSGGAGADDLTYDLAVDLWSANDEHPFTSPAVVNAGDDVTTAVGWGYGGTGQRPPNDLPRLPRSQADYDAEVDVVWFQYQFPGTTDQSLSLKWTISPAPGQQAGQRSYDVGFHFIFCATPDCSQRVHIPDNGGSPHGQNVFAYTNNEFNPWYLGEPSDAGYAGMQKGFEPFDPDTGVFQVADVMCICLDQAYATAGKFLVGVHALNRTSYVDSPVRLQFSLGAYPPTVTDDNGKSFPCPVPCGSIAKSNWSF